MGAAPRLKPVCSQTWSADQLFPEWDLWSQFINDDFSSALRLDALRSSHPIQVPINHAHEVEEVRAPHSPIPDVPRGVLIRLRFSLQVFDAISYCKGATVIRMLHAVVGEEAFRKGLKVLGNAPHALETVSVRCTTALDGAA